MKPSQLLEAGFAHMLAMSDIVADMYNGSLSGPCEVVPIFRQADVPCGCGCGAEIPLDRGPRSVYASELCKRRAKARRFRSHRRERQVA
jgi:hypothetical protein